MGDRFRRRCGLTQARSLVMHGLYYGQGLMNGAETLRGWLLEA